MPQRECNPVGKARIYRFGSCSKIPFGYLTNTRLGKTASSYEQTDNQQKDMLRMVLAGEATVKNPSVR